MKQLRYDPARSIDVLAVRRRAVWLWVQAHYGTPRRPWVSLQDTWIHALREAKQ